MWNAFYFELHRRPAAHFFPKANFTLCTHVIIQTWGVILCMSVCDRKINGHEEKYRQESIQQLLFYENGSPMGCRDMASKMPTQGPSFIRIFPYESSNALYLPIHVFRKYYIILSLHLVLFRWIETQLEQNTPIDVLVFFLVQFSLWKSDRKKHIACIFYAWFILMQHHKLKG